MIESYFISIHLTCEEAACQSDEEPSDDEELVGVADLADTHEDGAGDGEHLGVQQTVAAAEPIREIKIGQIQLFK